MLYSFSELYCGESFSTSLPDSCSVLPSRPLLRRRGDADAIIQRVVFFLGWVRLSIQFAFRTGVCENYWHKAKDSVCLPGTDDGVCFLCAVTHLSLFIYISVWGGILFCSIIFIVRMWQWRILTINLETRRVKSNIINFYNFVIHMFLAKESLCSLAIFFGFYSHDLHSDVDMISTAFHW